MNCIYAILLSLSYVLLPSCSAIDKITATQFLRDPETLVSNNGALELGFFNPAKSTNRYVGIWYTRVPKIDVVWVANRNNPLNDSSGGMIRISEDGNLQILNGRNQTLWSSNVSLASQTDDLPVAQLLDSGNLVLQGVNGRVLWQSFEHPTDTSLPNMKLAVTEDSGLKYMLQSWKNLSGPSNGRFSIGIDSFAFPQLVIWEGDRPYWRSGPWNGNIFIRMQSTNSNIVDAGFILENDRQGTVSLTYSYTNNMLSNYELNYKGTFTQKWWDESKREWEAVWQAPETVCDVYGKCGPFGSCNPFNSPICRCLKGFEPINKLEWSKGNRTGGCIRRLPLQCRSGNGKQDGFFKITGVKVPDNADWSTGLDQNECRTTCLNNCSCLAYMYITGAGCMSWARDLTDTEELSTGGVDLYLRLAHSELGVIALLALLTYLDHVTPHSFLLSLPERIKELTFTILLTGNNTKVVIVVAVTGSLGAASVVFFIFLLWRRKIQKQGNSYAIQMFAN